MSNFFPDALPAPAVERDTRKFWEAASKHRLVIQRCTGCGAYRHPPVPVCGECHSFEHEYTESHGVGEVYSWIVVHQASHPALKESVPYNAVVVRLRDCGGAKIVSNLVGIRNDEIKMGMAVRVMWEDVREGVSFPRF